MMTTCGDSLAPTVQLNHVGRTPVIGTPTAVHGNPADGNLATR